MDDCLPALFNDAELADDWSAVLQKLRTWPESGAGDTLPDWLAVEMIWMNVRFTQQLSLLDDPEQRHKLEQLLAQLNDLPCWRLAVEFDEQFTLFDPAYLQEQGISEEITRLSQFLAWPKSDKLSPHPLFDCAYYRQYKRLGPLDPHPLVHFFRHASGYREISAAPNPYFDSDWYRDNFLRDRPGENPLLHYWAHFREPRIQPSEYFNNHYLRLTQQLSSDEDPLVFYIKQVQNQGIEFCRHGFSPCPYFDRDYYLARYHDMRAATEGGGFDPFHHFWLYGIKEGRLGHAWLPQTMATQAEMLAFASQKKQAIVVLGMHRSGTSALTRAINLLGVDLASQLMEANFANETGYWESIELAKIHDDILSSLHTRWDDVLPINDSRFETLAIAHYKFLLSDYVVREFSPSRHFALKDPRMCKLVPLWLAVLGDLNVQVKIVIPFRNPLEVAGSLGRRDGFSLEKSLLLWLRHVIEAEPHTRGLSRCFVGYTQLLTDYRGVLVQIAGQCDMQWPDYSEAGLAGIGQFIDAHHYHQRVADDELMGGQVPAWITQAYAALNGLSQKNDEGYCMEQLDKIYESVHQADRLYGAVIAEQTQTAWQLQEAHKRIQAETRLFAERIGQLAER